MKNILIILMIASSFSGFSQDWKHSVRESWKVATPMFLAGAMNATVEVLKHDYGSFKRKFPKANDQFWDPNTSWNNKWKIDENGNRVEKFYGSSTVFVATTDAYHAIRLAENTTYLVTINISLNQPKKSFKDALIKTGIASLAWYTGFNLTYECLRR